MMRSATLPLPPAGGCKASAAFSSVAACAPAMAAVDNSGFLFRSNSDREKGTAPAAAAEERVPVEGVVDEEEEAVKRGRGCGMRGKQIDETGPATRSTTTARS